MGSTDGRTGRVARGRARRCASAIAYAVLVLLVLSGLPWLGGAACAQAPMATASGASGGSRSLKVVTDENFPPYLFRNADGEIEGYLADYWRLWERKTGIRVELIATNWAEAQRRLLAGEADVIDMIYRTPARERLYEFSPPYADMPVPIYHHVSIGGIGDVAALKGFQVGVQAGDACIDELRSKGITDLRPYPSYASLIDAAQRLEIKIFCLDESPANFYLYRAGAETSFRKGFVLYTGQFHRAVRRGNVETLRVVEQGMQAITPAEDAALRERWFGTPIGLGNYGRYVAWVVAVLLVLGVAQLLWNFALRRQVAAKTAALKASLGERDEAHRASLVARESLAATLEAIPDLLFEFDGDGRYVGVYASQQNEALLPRRHLVGRNVRDVLPGAAAGTVVAAVGAALANGSDYGRTVEYVVRGATRTFELSVSRKRANPEDPPTALVLSREITERRIADQALREAKAAADAASDAKSRFLATMSHEIRTPLNAVLGLAQVLEGLVPTGEPRELVQRIRAAGTGLLRSLNDVLDLAKIESGHLDIERQAFRLGPVLVDAAALMNSVAAAKGLVLQVDDGGSASLVLLGDAVRIGQVLVNLIANAVRFSDRGAIVVRVAIVERDGASVRLRFEVRDQGVGIRSEDRATIFLPFRQGDGQRDRRGGTGLGLAICRELVELMGGEIGVDSHPGEGSTFWFTLPFEVTEVPEGTAAPGAIVAGPDGAPGAFERAGFAVGADASGSGGLAIPTGVPDTAGRTGAAGGAGGAGGSGTSGDPGVAGGVGTTGPLPRLPGVRLLVVDDSAMNLDLVDRVLKREGAIPVLALDGQQALDLLARQPTGFDAVLMDLQMPVLDGLTATRVIRADARLAGIPVVAWSAGAYASDRRDAMAAGADAFVAKPIDNDVLVGVLSRCIGARRAPGRSGPGPQQPEAGSVPITGTPVVPPGPASPASSDPVDAALPGIPDGWPIVAGIEGAHVARLLDGDRAFFVDLLRRFLAEYGEASARLAADLAQGDRKTAAAFIHRLRGTAGYVGAMELVRASQQLEDALRAESAELDEIVGRFDACLAALNDGMRSALEREAPASAGRVGAASEGAAGAGGAEGAADTMASASTPASAPASAVDGAPPPDRELLVERSAELDQLLAQHLLKARRIVDELDGMLAGTPLQATFAPVAAAARELRFDEARAALASFAQQLREPHAPA